MVTPYDATAMAIFMFEGARLCNPNVRCIRNNNPGNLRPLSADQPCDDGDYRVFPTFRDGWNALTTDILAKVTRHLKPTSTMVDFFNLYAPGADHNDPHGYAQFVCKWLSDALDKQITLQSTIQEIFRQ